MFSGLFIGMCDCVGDFSGWYLDVCTTYLFWYLFNIMNACINKRLAFKLYKSVPVCLFVLGPLHMYIICVYFGNFFWCHFFGRHILVRLISFLICDCPFHTYCFCFHFHFKPTSFGIETNSQVQTNEEEVCVFFFSFLKPKEIPFPRFLYVCVDFRRNRKVYFCFTTTMPETKTKTTVHTLWSVMGIIK